jgi:hypothetical protein
MIYRTLVLAGLLTLTLATPARAGYITGVTATTNMGSINSFDIDHIVDGSGLSPSPSLTATHAAANSGNSWASAFGTVTGQVNFDLHGAYTLVGMSVWNYNDNSFLGVQGVSVSTSMDGVTFTPLAGGPTTFAEGLFFSPEPPQQFTFGPVVADFVRFDITSNYGSRNLTGLSEVGFDGTLTAVPVPPTWVLGLVGVGAGCVARLRWWGR